MKSMIVRWGNSQGVRLPKELLEAVALKVGDPVRITADAEGIRIRKDARRHRTLAERLDGYSGEHRPTEWDTGAARGKEEIG